METLSDMISNKNLLAIDIGNSEIKLHNGNDFFHFEYSDDIIHKCLNIIDNICPDFIGISSVNLDIFNRITNELKSRKIKFNNIENLLNKNNIIDFSRIKGMGTDRKCGLIAAGTVYNFPIITVDFGTAITINYADSDKICQGGMIAPGLLTQAKSLKSFTSALPLVSPNFSDVLLADNTEAAINSGIINITLAGIDHIINSIKDNIKSNSEPRVIFTGGGFNMIQDYPFETKYIYDSYLVLKGIIILSSIE